MSETLLNPRAVLGGNRQPLETYLKDLVTDLPERVEAELTDEIAATNSFVASAADVPGNIENDEEERVASDILAQMNKHHKVVESRREGIKAPILQMGKIIDNVAKTKGQAPLEQQINRINPGMTRYKREKVERERRAREEAERLAREEAERKRQEAEAAERQRREAEAAKQRAIEEQKRAEAAAARAKQEALEAEQRRREAEARRIEQERLAEEASSKRKREEAARAARRAQEDAERAEREKKEARERQERERAAAAEAKTETALAKAEASDANKIAKTADKLAAAAETDAHKATKATEAKASTLSGSRGDYGGHTSLRTVWIGELVDVDLLDKKAIWPFIKKEHLQAAVDAFVRMNKGSKELKGARIYETDANTIRS